MTVFGVAEKNYNPKDGHHVPKRGDICDALGDIPRNNQHILVYLVNLLGFYNSNNIVDRFSPRLSDHLAARGKDRARDKG